MLLRLFDVPGPGVGDIVFDGGSHDLVGSWKRMNSVLSPLSTDLVGLFLFQQRAKAQHTIRAQHPEIARPAREESIPDVLPQSKNVRP